MLLYFTLCLRTPRQICHKRSTHRHNRLLQIDGGLVEGFRFCPSVITHRQAQPSRRWLALYLAAADYNDACLVAEDTSWLVIVTNW